MVKMIDIILEVFYHNKKNHKTGELWGLPCRTTSTMGCVEDFRVCLEGRFSNDEKERERAWLLGRLETGGGQAEKNRGKAGKVQKIPLHS